MSKQLTIEELREQKRFFSYDPIDCEFDLHGTLEEAKEKAEYILDFYKGEAHESGWEDGVSEICYGEIKGESVVTLHEYKKDFTEEEWNEKYNSPDWDECIDYEIKSLEPKHETVEQWEARTGQVYPDDAPVWFKGIAWGCDWVCRDYEQVIVRCEINNEPLSNYHVYVATHHGKPEIEE